MILIEYGLTRLLAVYDGSDNLLMRFKYADGRMPVAMTCGGSTYYLTYDQVGSLRVVADASGNVVKRIDYDSFGNIIDDTNTTFMVPFGFAGGLHDRDTGLVRFGYRDYDPDVGRWTAKDPILFAGGDTDLYGYCLNDPLTFIDPFGLDEDFNRYMKNNLDASAKVGLLQEKVEHFFWHTVPVGFPKACKALRKKAEVHSDLINNLPDYYKPPDHYNPPSIKIENKGKN